MDQIVQGYLYKTVSVRTAPGVYKYNINVGLSDAGLPEGAIVLGISARKYDDGRGNAPYSSLVKIQLVKKTVLDGSFITLKDKNTQTIISQYHFPRLIDDPFFFESMAKYNIDWNNSFIEISNTVASGDINDNSCFEFIIIYTMPCNSPIARDWQFRIGEYFENARFKLIYIPTTGNTPEYALAPSTNVGIDENAILIGIDFNMPPVNYRATSDVQKSSVYFKLIRGSFLMLDTIPIAQSLMGKPRSQFQREYLPVQPTRVGDIDWQGSKIQFMDPTAPQSGEALALGLIYVNK